jgi:hypothetical protein
MYYLGRSTSKPRASWGLSGPKFKHFDRTELTRLDKLDLPKRRKEKSWSLVAARPEVRDLTQNLLSSFFIIFYSLHHSHAQQFLLHIVYFLPPMTFFSIDFFIGTISKRIKFYALPCNAICRQIHMPCCQAGTNYLFPLPSRTPTWSTLPFSILSTC